MKGNPNSKRGQVRTAFESGGEAAAIKVGATIGIPENKVKRWIRKFLAPKPNMRTTSKQKVFVKGFPEELGIVVEDGPEQCIVLWEDGVTRCEVVRHLRLHESGERYYSSIEWADPTGKRTQPTS
jgi:hypothetical protein